MYIWHVEYRSIMLIRTFISIPVPNTMGLKPLIRDIQAIRGLKPSSINQLHITLRFIGDVEEDRIDEIEEIVNNAIRNVKRGRLNLKGVGAFPNERNPRILWVGIDSELPLVKITEEISRGLKSAGIQFDEKPFKPHITVGRIEGHPNLTHLINNYRNMEFTTYIPDSIRIMKSELTPKGAEHTIMRVCYLK